MPNPNLGKQRQENAINADFMRGLSIEAYKNGLKRGGGTDTSIARIEPKILERDATYWTPTYRDVVKELIKRGLLNVKDLVPLPSDMPAAAEPEQPKGKVRERERKK